MDSSKKQFTFFSNKIDFENCVVTIGNFDGCHLGHQKLIQNNIQWGGKYSCPNLVLSFHPHPQKFIHPELEIKHLLTPERKTRALKELGAQAHYVLNFNDELNKMEHQDFYQKFLKNFLHAKAITVGENFHFGFQRKGDSQWLKNEGAKDKVHVDLIPSVFLKGEPISSTRVRKSLIEEGNVEFAKELLGHSYSIEGKTIKGDQLGRQFGFSTLNIDAQEQIVPADGVYCGYVWMNKLSPDKEAPITHIDTKRLFRAVFSIGKKPTLKLKDPKLCIEAHILDTFDSQSEHYDWNIAFYFEKKLRGMMTFRNLDELKKQVAKDIALAKKLV